LSGYTDLRRGAKEKRGLTLPILNLLDRKRWGEREGNQIEGWLNIEKGVRRWSTIEDEKKEQK